MHDDTWLVHGGRDPRRQQGMVNPPVYHASTVLFETVAELAAAATARPCISTWNGPWPVSRAATPR
jgi:cystathionine beta-lyase